MELTQPTGSRQKRKTLTSNAANADRTIFGIDNGKAQTARMTTCNTSAATASASGGLKARIIEEDESNG
jgi:hypothetical protein